MLKAVGRHGQAHLCWVGEERGEFLLGFVGF